MDIFSVNEDISYIKVPYKDIYVGIYLITVPGGCVLFDTGATAEDMDSYILPMAQQLGVTPTHIFISHDHTDHVGGLSRASELFPEAVILSRSHRLAELYPNHSFPEDGETLLDVLQVITIPGHTRDCMALLDRRSGTLITGDCLQSYGIYGSGTWYGVVRHVKEHLAALKKLESFPIEILATAHDYHPDGQISFGAQAVHARIQNCIGAFLRVKEIHLSHLTDSDEAVADLCNDGRYPTIRPEIAGCLRDAIRKGVL